jgi:hypothetical protein
MRAYPERMIVPPGYTTSMTDAEVIAAYADIGIPADTARRYLPILRSRDTPSSLPID